jgi:ribosomal protein S6E (S10)
MWWVFVIDPADDEGISDEDPFLPDAEQIFVKSMTGKTITLDVETSDTTEKTKAKIAEQTGIPSDKLLLIHRGKALDDNFSLAHYGIQKESEITVSARLLGGMGKRGVPMQTSVDKRERLMLLRQRLITAMNDAAVSAPIQAVCAAFEQPTPTLKDRMMLMQANDVTNMKLEVNDLSTFKPEFIAQAMSSHLIQEAVAIEQTIQRATKEKKAIEAAINYRLTVDYMGMDSGRHDYNLLLADMGESAAFVRGAASGQMDD